MSEQSTTVIAPDRMTADDLKAWLRSRGWSNYRLAKALGRQERTVGRWVNDESDPPPELRLTLVEVDRQYGLTPA